MNIFIVYEINLWSFRRSDFTLGKVLFGAARLVKNANEDKYSGLGVGFDNHGTFSLSNGSGFFKIVITFRADMSLSAHVDNNKKNTLIL